MEEPRRTITTAQALGWIAAGVGASVLVGWAFDLPLLKTMLPGAVSMKANTALGFLLAGLSLVLPDHRPGCRLAIRTLASWTALIGLLTLAEYAFRLDLGIDQMLFEEAPGTVGTLSPGRMAPTTAASFLLVGCSRILASSRRTIPGGQGAALLVALLGFLSIAGYVTGATELIGVGRYTQMALHTAVLFLVLGVALLLIHPAEGLMQVVRTGTPGGWLLERVLPAMIGVPLLIGWLGARGVREGHWNPPFGIALVVVLLVVALTSITYWAGGRLNASETAWRQAEAALREVRSILQAAMDQSQAGIAIADAPTGALRYVNDAGLFIRGEDRDAVVHGIGIDRYVASWQLFDLDGTPLPADAVPLARAIQHGETNSREFIIRRSPTDDRVVLAKAAPITDAQGKVTAAVVVFVDITDRRIAEEALRTSEKHFRQLVQALPIPVGYVNSRGDVVTTNPRITEVLGYTPEDIPTADEWFRRAFPDDDYRQKVLQKWAEDLGEAIEKGREVPPAEYNVTCKNGEFRIMSIAGVPVGEDLLVTMQDVTETRAMQAKLALASRLAAMGTLVTGVAHEINNPLAAIMASAGTATEDVAELQSILSAGSSPDPGRLVCRAAEVHEMLGDVTASARRIAGIVKDLAVFGRPDPDRRPTRLDETIQRSLGWLPPFVAERAVVRVEVEEVPEAMASESQIAQVLVNLVDNAALAIPDDRRGEVLIRLGRGLPEMVRLEVSDNGRGIAPELMERIFEPFFTTRPQGKGTGLGLSICNAIVTAHGGTLTVKSEVGKGSTFRVELPAAAPAEA